MGPLIVSVITFAVAAIFFVSAFFPHWDACWGRGDDGPQMSSASRICLSLAIAYFGLFFSFSSFRLSPEWLSNLVWVLILIGMSFLFARDQKIDEERRKKARS